MTQAALDPTTMSPNDDPLRRGDDAAEREDWPSAVTAWRRALSSASRDEAVARLEWFIAWRTDHPVGQTVDRPFRKPIELFLGFLACCLFTVAAVFLTEDLTGSLAVVTMVAAWLFIVGAAVLSLLYARYSEPEPAGTPHLGERQVRSLAERATRLAAQDDDAHRRT